MSTNLKNLSKFWGMIMQLETSIFCFKKGTNFYYFSICLFFLMPFYYFSYAFWDKISVVACTDKTNYFRYDTYVNTKSNYKRTKVIIN